MADNVQLLESMTPDQRRDARLRAVYGISLDQYNQMLKDQNGLCLICCDPPRPGHVLVVDHNHDTGQVRALLCSECNSALGLLGDDPDRLFRAQAYLRKYGDYEKGHPEVGTDPSAVKQSHPGPIESTNPDLNNTPTTGEH